MDLRTPALAETQEAFGSAHSYDYRMTAINKNFIKD
jgi:hypothetical protein